MEEQNSEQFDFNFSQNSFKSNGEPGEYEGKKFLNTSNQEELEFNEEDFQNMQNDVQHKQYIQDYNNKHELSANNIQIQIPEEQSTFEQDKEQDMDQFEEEKKNNSKSKSNNEQNDVYQIKINVPEVDELAKLLEQELEEMFANKKQSNLMVPIQNPQNNINLLNVQKGHIKSQGTIQSQGIIEIQHHNVRNLLDGIKMQDEKLKQQKQKKQKELSIELSNTLSSSRMVMIQQMIKEYQSEFNVFYFLTANKQYIKSFLNQQDYEIEKIFYDQLTDAIHNNYNQLENNKHALIYTDYGKDFNSLQTEFWSCSLMELHELIIKEDKTWVQFSSDLLFLTKTLVKQVIRINFVYNFSHNSVNMHNIVITGEEFRIKDLNIQNEPDSRMQSFVYDDPNYNKFDQDLYAVGRIIYFLGLSGLENIFTEEDHFRIYSSKDRSVIQENLSLLQEHYSDNLISFLEILLIEKKPSSHVQNLFLLLKSVDKIPGMSSIMIEMSKQLENQKTMKECENLVQHLEKCLFLGLKNRQFLLVNLIYDQLYFILEYNQDKDPRDLCTDLIQVYKRELKKLQVTNPDIQTLEEIQRRISRLSNKLRELVENYSGESKADSQFAQLSIQINWVTEGFYLVKQFKNDEYYEEKQNIIEIQRKYGDKLSLYAISLQKHQDTTLKLFFEDGECTLKEYQRKIANSQNFTLISQNIKYVFKKLIQFVLYLNTLDYYHSDLKPSNIILMKTKQANFYQIKVTDLGTCSNNFKAYKVWTERYFNSPLRKRDQYDYLIFDNKYERLKNEVYQVCRIFQEMCLKIIEQSLQKNINLLFCDNQNLQIQKEIMNIIEDQYEQIFQQDYQLKEIFLFIRDKILQEKENYTEKQLSDLANSINENFLIDRLDIIDNIQKEKVVKYVKDGFVYNEYDKQLGLDILYPIKCAYSSSQSDLQFDLVKETQLFIKGKKRLFIVMGESGSGKSTFSQQITLQLFSERHINRRKLIPIYVDLQKYKNKPKQFEQLFKKVCSGIEQNIWKIFILDNYDLFNSNQMINIPSLIGMANRIDIKLIVTCNNCYMNEKDLFYNFSLQKGVIYSVVYISPLKQVERKQFLEEYIQRAKKNQIKLYGVQMFDNIQKYEEQILIYPLFLKACQSPQNLKMIVPLMKGIKKQYQTGKNFIYSKFIEMRNTREIAGLTEVDRESYNQIGIIYPEFMDDLNLSITHFNTQIAIYLSQNNIRSLSIEEYNRLVDSYLCSLREKNQQKKDHEMENKIRDLLLKLSPLSFDDNNFSFIHHSFNCFYLSNQVIKELEKLVNFVSNQSQFKKQCISMVLNIIQLTDDMQTTKDVIEALQNHQKRKELEHVLVGIMLLTKQSLQFDLASSNAASILNLSGYSFSGMNISKIRIPRAQLQNGNFQNCNLCGAYLINTNLSNSNFTGAILQDCNLSDSNFGIFYPKIHVHKGKINQIDIDQNGKHLITCSDDGQIFVWKIKDYQKAFSIQKQSCAVNSVQFSLNGKYIASAYSDHTVKIWSSFTGEQLQNLYLHTAEVKSVCFSQNSQLLASGGKDKVIKVWSIEQKTQLKQFLGHEDTVNYLQFSYDNQFLLSCGDDLSINIWSLKQNEGLVKSFIGHKQPLQIAIFSPNDQYIASCSLDRTVRFWDIQKGIEIKQVIPNQICTQSIDFTPDGFQVVCGGDDNSLQIISFPEGLILKTIYIDFEKVTNVKFSRDFRYLAISSVEGYMQLLIYDQISWKQQQYFGLQNNHQNFITDIKLTKNDEILFTASSDYTIKQWDIVNSQIIRTVRGHKEGIRNLAISPDNSLMASASWDKTFRIWETQGCNEIKLIEFDKSEDEVNYVCFSPDQNFLAACGGIKIKIYNTKNYQLTHTMEGHKGTILSIQFSPNSSYLLSTSSDKLIKIWSVMSGQETDTLSHQSLVYKAIYSNDGLSIASACFNGQIKFWSVINGTKISSFRAHNTEIYSLQFSSDDSILVSSGQDGAVKMWNCQNYQLIQQILQENKPVFTALIGQNMNKIYANTGDQIIIIAIDIQKTYKQQMEIQQQQYQQIQQNIKDHSKIQIEKSNNHINNKPTSQNTQQINNKNLVQKNNNLLSVNPPNIMKDQGNNINLSNSKFTKAIENNISRTQIVNNNENNEIVIISEIKCEYFIEKILGRQQFSLKSAIIKNISGLQSQQKLLVDQLSNQ